MTDQQKSKRYALIALIATKQAKDYEYSTGLTAAKVADLAKQL